MSEGPPRWRVRSRRRQTVRAERKRSGAGSVSEVLLEDAAGDDPPRVVARFFERHGGFWLLAAGAVPGGRHVFVLTGASCMGDSERRLVLYPVTEGAPVELPCHDRAGDGDVLFSRDGTRVWCRWTDPLGRVAPWYTRHDLVTDEPATRVDALPDEPLVTLGEARSDD